MARYVSGSDFRGERVRVVYWLVTLVVAVIVVIFAISNRDMVTVAFWPLPVLFEMRLCLLVIAAAIVGFLFGEMVAWISGRRWRREARRRGRRVDALERELAATQSQLSAQTPAAGAGIPPGGGLARLPAAAGPARH